MRELMFSVVNEASVDYPTKSDLAGEFNLVHNELNVINLRLEHMERRWGKTEEKLDALFGNEQENRIRIRKLEQRLTHD